MKLPGLLTQVAGFVGAARDPSSVFENTADISKIPTSYESAVMGRRILALSKLATLSTVFPQDSDSGIGATERRPAGLGGIPIGLMDYVADCEDAGNPTILAIEIATSFKNVREGSNITLSMRWTPPYPPSQRISAFSRLASFMPFVSQLGSSKAAPEDDSSPASNNPDPVPYSAANLPRFSLIGYLEYVKPGPLESVRLASCFTRKHQDAKYWLPGNMIHTASWARIVVTEVYWIGGFGDRAYIGWIPVEEWQNVTTSEWQSIRLPGEKRGWKEWSVGDEL